MDWLNYHHLYYFWMVCKEGGYAKAALKLRIAQSAVSSQIIKLEEALGEKLLDRGPRGFTLTEAGEITLAQAEEIFRQGNDLLQYFKSGKMRSHFRVGALGGLSKNLQIKILQPVLEDSSMEISLEVGDPAFLLPKLLGYKLDAILSDLPFPSSESEPLMQREIAAEAICLVSRIKPNKIKNRDLKKIDFKNGIYLPSKSSPISSSIQEALRAKNLSYQVRGYVEDIALLRLLALETDAFVALPKIGALRELQAKELFSHFEFNKIQQKYFLVHRQKGKRHPVLNKLLKS